MKKQFFIYIILYALIQLLNSCAQPAALDGGPKDSIPPYMVKSFPVERAKNFKGKKIMLKFNEFFEFKNIEEQLIISPPMKEMPKYKIKGKYAIIKFKESLKDSVNYTIDFGNSIVDYNESNILKKFSFSFSTGDVIDTFAIAGRVIDAYSGKNLKGIHVMAYQQFNDSTPIKTLPDYYTKTDTLGEFIITNVKPGKYTLFALKDMNPNYLFDNITEAVAFLDTSFVPSMTATQAIDTLKKGTVVHDTGNNNKLDTIKRDTIIVSRVVKIIPSDIKMRLFLEQNFDLSVVNRERESAIKNVFAFSRGLKDSIEVNLLNYKPDNKWFLQELSPNRDTVTIWVTDKKTIALDTLVFNLKYKKDSMEFIKINNDTFELSVKKITKVNSKYAKPVVQPTKKYLQLQTNARGDFDLFKQINLVTDNPVLKFDKEKIVLYEIRDSNIVDTKKQELLKFQRRSKETIFVALKQPNVKDPQLFLDNYTKNSWYQVQSNLSNDSIQFKITNDSIAGLDTLKLSLHYTNMYYNNFVQHFSNKQKLGVAEQKVIKASRPQRDSIHIHFNKPLLSEPELTIVNFQQTGLWYQLSKQDNRYFIKITDEKVVARDTILLQIKGVQGFDKTGREQFFTESLNFVFAKEKQKIKDAWRQTSNQFYCIFNIKNVQPIEFSYVDDPVKNWFKAENSTNKDTITFTFNDDIIKNATTTKITIKYSDETNKQRIDTFNLKIAPRHSIGSKPKTSEKNSNAVKIPFKHNFEMIQDSLQKRKFTLKTKFTPGKTYCLSIDSTAFYDVYNNPNDTISTIFTTQKPNQYGTIRFQIKNIGAIVNKNFLYFDNKKFKENCKGKTQITIGNCILQLLDDKENFVKDFNIKSDTELKFDLLPAGKYKIRLIYDINNNKKWDTGKYIKHLQPEPVLYYPKTFESKANVENSLEWDLTGNSEQ